jgi:hypothetical protein
MNNKIVNMVIGHHLMICQMCVRLNPQHKDCLSCEDMEETQEFIKEQTGKDWEKIKKETYEESQ